MSTHHDSATVVNLSFYFHNNALITIIWVNVFIQKVTIEVLVSAIVRLGIKFWNIMNKIEAIILLKKL